ncbi:MAG: UvrD-helicase domain-containing protein [bacterium]
MSVITKTVSKLNSRQLEAVRHREGPLLILAGAGSGKTAVITHRVAHLIETGINPWNILAITFTNRAAQEMRNRVFHLVPGQAHAVTLSTFHSFCARFLRREALRIKLNPHFIIYNDKDQKNLIKRCLDVLGIDDKKYRPGLIAELINRAKDDLLDAGSFAIHAATSGDSYRRLIAQVYESYDQEMNRAGSLDFGDLIMKTVEALRDTLELKEIYQHRFKYIMIDEYQDTNKAQYMLVKYLAGAHKNLAVVGDDDQAIYRWRGADIRNILEFERDFKNTKVIKLEQNYRSTKVILDTAWSLIKNNTARKEKKLWTLREGGDPVQVKEAYNEQDEAQFVVSEIKQVCAEGASLRDFAVFYRTNAQSRVFEDALRRMDMPYKIFGAVRFYDRLEVKDILSYLNVIINHSDSLSLRRIINIPARGIGKTTRELLDAHAVKHSITLYEAVAQVDQIPKLSPRIKMVLKEFKKMLDGFTALSQSISAKKLMKEVLERTGYLVMLEEEDSPEADSRIANLKELVTAVDEYVEKSDDPAVSGFLEQVSLISDIDTLNVNSPYVTLMTLHLAKGLEFENVFITGMEEGLFPIGEAVFDMEELEEERRLAYVGMTRAKHKLYLLHASSRKLYGQKRWNIPSRFLAEAGFKSNNIDPDEMSGEDKVQSDFAGEETYAQGDKIKHAQFGEGIITQQTGSGETLKVTVRFNSGIWKKLMVKYAPIEKLS